MLIARAPEDRQWKMSGEGGGEQSKNQHLHLPLHIAQHSIIKVHLGQYAHQEDQYRQGERDQDQHALRHCS